MKRHTRAQLLQARRAVEKSMKSLEASLAEGKISEARFDALMHGNRKRLAGIERLLKNA
jgi:hypothetical protein